ncbi:hypothetical protein MTO96_012799 [Rhipicephalus appendiculatus]
MSVAANVSWDVSTVSYSDAISVDSRADLFGAVSPVDSLLTIKVPRRIGIASVACRIKGPTGLQAALKTSLAAILGNLQLVQHGEMGRERCKCRSPIGFFGAVSPVDSLLTTKAPLMVRSASASCRVTVTNGPQEVLKTSLPSTVG